MELITQTTEILKQSAELIKNPAISGAITGLFGWLKSAFSNNKRAKERIEMIEKLETNDKEIDALQTNLDDLLYDNDELKKQLEAKINELQEIMKKEGVDNSVKTNTINVNNSTNTKIAQGIDTKGGDLTIN